MEHDRSVAPVNADQADKQLGCASDPASFLATVRDRSFLTVKDKVAVAVNFARQQRFSLRKENQNRHKGGENTGKSLAEGRVQSVGRTKTSDGWCTSMSTNIEESWLQLGGIAYARPRKKLLRQQPRSRQQRSSLTSVTLCDGEQTSSATPSSATRST